MSVTGGKEATIIQEKTGGLGGFFGFTSKTNGLFCCVALVDNHVESS